MSKKKIIIIGSIILVVGIILFFNQQNEKEDISLEEVKEEKLIEEPKKEQVVESLFVDIKGEVLNPGVYEATSNDRIINIINKSGGLTENADTSLLNLSKKISDSMVIIIYSKDEVKKFKEEEKVKDKIEEITNDALVTDILVTEEKEEENSISLDSNNTLININTATQEDFNSLPGIGDSKAKAIIDYRKENGNFKTIEELLEVSGIGESLFAKIKDYITI